MLHDPWLAPRGLLAGCHRRWARHGPHPALGRRSKTVPTTPHARGRYPISAGSRARPGWAPRPKAPAPRSHEGLAAAGRGAHCGRVVASRRPARPRLVGIAPPPRAIGRAHLRPGRPAELSPINVHPAECSRDPGDEGDGRVTGIPARAHWSARCPRPASRQSVRRPGNLVQAAQQPRLAPAPYPRPPGSAERRLQGLPT